jgi:hypothetical protein
MVLPRSLTVPDCCYRFCRKNVGMTETDKGKLIRQYAAGEISWRALRTPLVTRMTNRLTALSLVTALAACSGPSDTYRRLYGSTEDKRQHDLNCLDAVVHDVRIGMRADEVHHVVDNVGYPWWCTPRLPRPARTTSGCSGRGSERATSTSTSPTAG